MFSWSSYSKPAIVLSPMSGYTDSAFKQIVRYLAPKAVLFTEFVSSDAVAFKSPKTLRMMAFDQKEHPVILQVFGKKVENFVETAKIAEKMGYDGIDINMGCPAKKIIRSEHGSALVKIENQQTAFKIVSEMSSAVKIPVSVKTRLGWTSADDLVEFCKKLEKYGCASICIHGRTTRQGYGGEANWEPIYEVKRALKIPVFGNGDIRTVSDFRKKLGNLDGVFIGRAAIGDPLLISDIFKYLSNREEYDQLSDASLDLHFPRGGDIAWGIKKPIVIKHCRLAAKTKGEQLGVLEMRKHLAVYIKGLPGVRDVRNKLMKACRPDEVSSIINAIRITNAFESAD